MGQDDQQLGIRPLWVALLAVAMWLFTPIAPVQQVVPYILPLLPFLASPAFRLIYERGPRGKIKFEWTWQDWVGLTIFIVVLYAIYTGTDPVTLLDKIGKLVTKKA